MSAGIQRRKPPHPAPAERRLDGVNLADGKERWAYEIGSPITGSPAVARGAIVIGAEDGSVYCFGAK